MGRDNEGREGRGRRGRKVREQWKEGKGGRLTPYPICQDVFLFMKSTSCIYSKT